MAHFNIAEQGRGFRYSDAQKRDVLAYLKKNQIGKVRNKPIHRHGTYTEILNKFGVGYPTAMRWIAASSKGKKAVK